MASKDPCVPLCYQSPMFMNLTMNAQPNMHQYSAQEKNSIVDGDPNGSPMAESQRQPEKELTTRSFLTLAGGFAVLFVSIGYINAFGVFQEYYMQHMLADRSPSAISWIGSFNLFCLFGGSLGTGVLNDVYGPRILISIGGFITVFAMFMTSLCTEYYQFFLAQGFLLGIGITFLFCPAMATIPLYFKANRGLALGVVVSGSSVGGVIWPIALQRLLVEVGFGWTVRLATLMTILLVGFAYLTVRPPVKSIQSGPKQRKTGDLSVAKNKPLVLISISLFFICLGLYSPYFYFPSYMVSLGHASDLAFYTISILNAASLFGRILPGILADRYGQFNIFILACGMSFVIVFCWVKATSIAGTILFSLAYGFSSGTTVSLMNACVTQTVEPAQYGTAIGLSMSILSIATLVGPPINGQLLENHGYLALSIFSGAGLLLGTIGMVVTRLKIDHQFWAKV